MLFRVDPPGSGAIARRALAGQQVEPRQPQHVEQLPGGPRWPGPAARAGPGAAPRRYAGSARAPCRAGQRVDARRGQPAGQDRPRPGSHASQRPAGQRRVAATQTSGAAHDPQAQRRPVAAGDGAGQRVLAASSYGGAASEDAVAGQPSTQARPGRGRRRQGDALGEPARDGIGSPRTSTQRGPAPALGHGELTWTGCPWCWGPRRPAGRGSTAARSARASALNWASTMWCGSRPDSTRTCRAIPACAANVSNTCRVSEPHVATADQRRTPGRRLAVVHAVRPAGHVDRPPAPAPRPAGTERVAEPADAALVAERLAQRLAEHDGDVLDGVVGVDVDVTGRRDVQVEQRVLGQAGEHVVVEPDPGARPRPRRCRRGRGRRRPSTRWWRAHAGGARGLRRWSRPRAPVRWASATARQASRNAVVSRGVPAVTRRWCGDARRRGPGRRARAAPATSPARRRARRTARSWRRWAPGQAEAGQRGDDPVALGLDRLDGGQQHVGVRTARPARRPGSARTGGRAAGPAAARRTTAGSAAR